MTLIPDGSFTAVPASPPSGNDATATVTFQYTAVNSQQTSSAPTSVAVTFESGSGLAVRLWDAPSFSPGKRRSKSMTIGGLSRKTERSKSIPHAKSTRVRDRQLSTSAGSESGHKLPHQSYADSRCRLRWNRRLRIRTNRSRFRSELADLSTARACSVRHWRWILPADAQQQIPADPSHVHLDPTKHYYISVLPGDAGNTFGPEPELLSAFRRQRSPFNIAAGLFLGGGRTDFAPGTGTCGHGMSGAPIAPAQTAVDVKLQKLRSQLRRSLFYLRR